MTSTLITSLNHLGLSVSYDEVLRYQTDLATYTISTSSVVIAILSHFDPNCFTLAAFDNFDHEEATPSGIGGSLDTVCVLFQVRPETSRMKPHISASGIKHGERGLLKTLPCQEVLKFIMPAKKPSISEQYELETKLFAMPEATQNVISMMDFAWLVLRSGVIKCDDGDKVAEVKCDTVMDRIHQIRHKERHSSDSCCVPTCHTTASNAVRHSLHSTEKLSRYQTPVVANISRSSLR